MSLYHNKLLIIKSINNLSTYQSLKKHTYLRNLLPNNSNLDLKIGLILHPLLQQQDELDLLIIQVKLNKAMKKLYKIVHLSTQRSKLLI